MAYRNDFNLLGRVDGSKTIITPQEFYFKMKEANILNDTDYAKFKLMLNDYKITLDQKNYELLEREKDRNFQLMFKELWPSIYDRIYTPKPPPLAEQTTLEKLKADLEKDRLITALIKQQEEERKKAELNKPPLPSMYSSIYSSRLNDSVNISIKGGDKNGTKIEISTPSAHSTIINTDTLKSTSLDRGIISGYNMPSFDKHSYQRKEFQNDSKILESLKESREKLKYAQNLEKTSNLVDGILNEVKTLQTEMRRKSTDLKLKEIEVLRKEKEAAEVLRKSTELLRRSTASLRFESDEDDVLRRSRTYRSRENLHSTLNCHHYSSLDLDSDSDDSTHMPYCHNRKSKIKSILKKTKYRPMSELSTSSSSSYMTRSRSSHFRPPNVSTKVECWNKNCRHDNKIY